MSRFFDGVDDRLEKGVAPITAAPVTLACWFRAENLDGFKVLLSLANSGSTNNFLYLAAAGSFAGDPVVATTQAGGLFFNAETTIGFSALVWHHAAAVFASATDRRAFIDGGSKGTNSSSGAPSGINRTSIGRVGDSTPGNHFKGRIAEAAVWDAALTDVEVAALAAGVSPLRVRSGNLKGYWAVFGVSPETDFSGRGNNLTVTGTTIADHAPVAPQFGFSGTEPDAVVLGPTGQPFRMRGMMIPGWAGGRFGRVA